MSPAQFLLYKALLQAAPGLPVSYSPAEQHKFQTYAGFPCYPFFKNYTSIPHHQFYSSSLLQALITFWALAHTLDTLFEIPTSFLQHLHLKFCWRTNFWNITIAYVKFFVHYNLKGPSKIYCFSIGHCQTILISSATPNAVNMPRKHHLSNISLYWSWSFVPIPTTTELFAYDSHAKQVFLKCYDSSQNEYYFLN